MTEMFAPRRRWDVILVLFALLPAGSAAAEGLQERLEALAAAKGFTVSGLERLAVAPAKVAAVPPAGAPLPKRIGALLEGYNYVLLYDGEGRITELRISGPAPAAAAVPARGSVATTRRGPHHVVEAELVGPNGTQHRVPLVLDTGATTVVLPLSMIGPLGFEDGDLADGWSQTAAGRVRIKRGWLESIKVGRMAEDRVAVSFIEDDKLGNQTLLGMSFLDRFRLTIDDQNDRIILMRK
jgi:aspartyl protease family protein